MLLIKDWYRKGAREPIELLYDTRMGQYYLRGFVRSEEKVEPLIGYKDNRKWYTGLKQLLSREFGLGSKDVNEIVAYFKLNKRPQHIV